MASRGPPPPRPGSSSMAGFTPPPPPPAPGSAGSSGAYPPPPPSPSMQAQPPPPPQSQPSPPLQPQHRTTGSFAAPNRPPPPPPPQALQQQSTPVQSPSPPSQSMLPPTRASAPSIAPFIPPRPSIAMGDPRSSPQSGGRGIFSPGASPSPLASPPSASPTAFGATVATSPGSTRPINATPTSIPPPQSGAGTMGVSEVVAVPEDVPQFWRELGALRSNTKLFSEGLDEFMGRVYFPRKKKDAPKEKSSIFSFGKPSATTPGPSTNPLLANLASPSSTMSHGALSSGGGSNTAAAERVLAAQQGMDARKNESFLASYTHKAQAASMPVADVSNLVAQLSLQKALLDERLESFERYPSQFADSLAAIQHKLSEHDDTKKVVLTKLQKYLGHKVGTNVEKALEQEKKIRTRRQLMSSLRFDAACDIRRMATNEELNVLRPMSSVLQMYWEFFDQGYKMLKPLAESGAIGNMAAYVAQLEEQAERQSQAFAMSKRLHESSISAHLASSSASALNMSLTGAGQSTGIRDLDFSARSGSGPQTKATEKEGYLYLPAPNFSPVFATISKGKINLNREALNLPDLNVDLMICTVKENRDAKLRWVFNIISPTETLLLQADSAEGFQDWISVIQNAISAQLNAGSAAASAASSSSSAASSQSPPHSHSSSYSSPSPSTASSPPSSGAPTSTNPNAVGQGSMFGQAKDGSGGSAALTALRAVPGNESCADCVAAGTLVTVASLGLSVPIEHVPADAHVLGLAAGNGGLVSRRVNAFLNKGERSCVELLFQDGRTLTVTPDHRLRCADGTWAAAIDLKVATTNQAGSQVAAGIEYPLWQDDVPAKFTLTAGPLTLEALPAVLFCRILGFMCSSPSIDQMRVAHQLDARQATDDIERVTGVPANEPSLESDGSYSVQLPLVIREAYLATGMATDTTTQLLSLPSFLLEPSCPVALVGAFLSGLFGAAGATVNLSHLQFSGLAWSCRKLGIEAPSQGLALPLAQKLMLEQQLIPLLARCGVVADVRATCEPTVWTADCSTPESLEARLRARMAGEPFSEPMLAGAQFEPSQSYELILSLGTDSVLAFQRGVGFQYGCAKQMRLTAACAYFRQVDFVQQQRRFVAERVQQSSTSDLPVSLDAAKKELALTAVVHPTILAWNPTLDTIDTDDLALTPKSALEAFDIAKLFVTASESTAAALPLFKVALIGRREVGAHAVFDLTVPSHSGSQDLDSFTANGLPVHNCSAKDPDWVSLNLGIVICMECSGVHRALGVHISKVRSTTLDKLDTYMVNYLSAVGNKLAGSVWEASLLLSDHSKRSRPNASSNAAMREMFIRGKYDVKSFLSPTRERSVDALNELMFTSIENGLLPPLVQALAWGANPAWPNPKAEQRSALHQAVMYSNLIIVECVIQFMTAELNKKEERGWTALHYAAYQNDKQLVELLILRGGSQLACEVDKGGQTPLASALAQCAASGEAIVPEVQQLLSAAEEKVRARLDRNAR